MFFCFASRYTDIPVYRISYTSWGNKTFHVWKNDCCHHVTGVIAGHWSFILQFGNYERSYPGCQFRKISDRSRVLLGLKSSSPIYIEMIIWNNFGYIIIHRKSFPLSVPMVPVNKNTPPALHCHLFPQKTISWKMVILRIFTNHITT